MLDFPHIEGHHFYRKLLEPNSVVIDLGAGKGEFTEGLKNITPCHCYAIEANPELYSQIKDTAHIKKFNYAVSASKGQTKFYISNNLDASSLDYKITSDYEINKTIVVPAVTFEDFLYINNIKSIDLLKIDIEGAEVELFSSMKDDILSNIRQITVEFHDFLKSAECKVEVARIIKRLKKIGFFCLRFRYYIDINVDVLFINKKMFKFSDPRYLYFGLLDILSLKYVFIIREILNRSIYKLKQRLFR